MPAPKAHSQGMINQYSGNAPTLRLLCSITGTFSIFQLWNQFQNHDMILIVIDVPNLSFSFQFNYKCAILLFWFPFYKFNMNDLIRIWSAMLYNLSVRYFKLKPKIQLCFSSKLVYRAVVLLFHLFLSPFFFCFKCFVYSKDEYQERQD